METEAKTTKDQGEFPLQEELAAALSATLTRCRDGRPLVELDSELFGVIEIRPADLHRLAQQLSAVAEMASRLPTSGERWAPTKVQIGDEGGDPAGAISDDRAACVAILKLILEMVVGDKKGSGLGSIRKSLVDLLLKISANSQLPERLKNRVRALTS